MSDAPTSEGPKRTSTEPTLAIPRDQLPPISMRDLAALELDPDHEETKELLQRAYASGDRETLDACPVCTIACPCCGGVGMASPARAAAFEAALRSVGVANDDAPPSDPEPEAA